jgi:hypothetical protein
MYSAMVRILGTCAALALIIIMAFPFARDAYHRYEVGKRLDSRDRLAFENWTGDPNLFLRSLLERCELVNGPGSPNCDAYK